MGMTVQVKFGSALVTKTSNKDDDGDAIKEITFIAAAPTICTNCKSTNVTLQHRTAKGYDFYGIKCHSCGAEARAGSYKEGGFFWKDGGKFTQFKGKVANNKTETDPFADEE